MYILKNAYKSITRNKSSNILIAIVICVIGISSCVALSINSSASKIVKNQTDSSLVLATFSINRETMRSNIQNGKIDPSSLGSLSGISEDKIKEYANSSYVKDYYLRLTTSLNSSNIKAASSTDFIDSYKKSSGSSSRPQGMGMLQSSSKGSFDLIGYNKSEGMTSFVQGTNVITSGEMIDLTSSNYECLINKELADQNTLTIGSKITFTNPNKADETYDFTVKGIYTDNSESSSNSDVFSKSSNQVMTSSNVIKDIVSKSDSSNKLTMNITPTIVLNNVDSVTPFISEVTSKGLDSNYQISTNKDSVESTIKPIENLKDFSNIFLILVLIIGSIILVILNMINIRERKYEVGVLRAIGMKKHKVSLQFLLEVFMVTIVAIILSIVIGSAISVPTSNYMLQKEISNIQTAQTNVESNFGGHGNIGFGNNNIFGTNNNSVSYIDKINASLNIFVVAKLFVIAISLTLISSLVSIIIISRYNPLKILSNRS